MSNHEQTTCFLQVCALMCSVCETYGPRCKQRVAVRNEWPKSAMFEDLEVPIAKRASGVLWFLICSYLPAVKKWQRSKHWPTGINCRAVQAHLRSVELWAQLWFGKYSQDLMIIPVKIAKIGATLGISVARGPLLDTQIHGLTRWNPNFGWLNHPMFSIFWDTPFPTISRNQPGEYALCSGVTLLGQGLVTHRQGVVDFRLGFFHITQLLTWTCWRSPGKKYVPGDVYIYTYIYIYVSPII